MVVYVSNSVVYFINSECSHGNTSGICTGNYIGSISNISKPDSTSVSSYCSYSGSSNNSSSGSIWGL